MGAGGRGGLREVTGMTGEQDGGGGLGWAMTGNGTTAARVQGRRQGH